MKYTKGQIFLGLTRISLGFLFFWAFFDKLFGLNFATTPEKSWLSGNSPTAGFLQFGTHGPLSSLFQNMAGMALIDWLFMAGLLLIGLSLLLGITMKIATSTGSLLFFFMWLALLPPQNNPVLDEHIVYILVLFVLRHHDAGKFFGFQDWWSRRHLVRKFTILQ